MFSVNIVGTGSKGNMNIIDDVIAIDLGMPARDLKPYAHALELVVISHEHGDHTNMASLNYLYKNHPWIISHGLLVNEGTYRKIEAKLPAVADLIPDTNIIDGGHQRTVKTTSGTYTLETYPLHHNVENQGFILTNEVGERLIHATDTNSMEDAPAGPYNYFLVEGNYDEDVVFEILGNPDKYDIEQMMRASQNLRHLSNQQCHQFILSHAADNALAWQLHESDAFGMRVDFGLGGTTTMVPLD